MAKRLDVPSLHLVVNKVLTSFDFDAVREQIEGTYDTGVIAVLPQCDEMMQLSSEGVFVLEYPSHPLTEAMHAMKQAVLDSPSA